jgi:hypothetical protein
MNDDALRASFRHHAIANSTNLPIYIEEALMDERSLSRLKSTGKNVRGNMDKSLTVYDVLATFVFSRNTESKDASSIDPLERKAQDKRILKFMFERGDVITSEKEKSTGRDFLKRITDLPGGVIYEKLKGITVTEIISKYRSLKQDESIQSEKDKKESSQIKVISKLGAWIMEDPDFKPEVTEPKQPTILDEFFSVIRDENERIMAMRAYADEDKYKTGTFLDRELSTNLDIDPNHEFKLTVHGFNLIKKSFGYNGNASAFARSYGFGYKTVSILGRHDKCIMDKIPKEYYGVKDDRAQTGKKEDNENSRTNAEDDDKEENTGYTVEYQRTPSDYRAEEEKELKRRLDEIGL